jgi:hypothetical protein
LDAELVSPATVVAVAAVKRIGLGVNASGEVVADIALDEVVAAAAAQRGALLVLALLAARTRDGA